MKEKLSFLRLVLVPFVLLYILLGVAKDSFVSWVKSNQKKSILIGVLCFFVLGWVLGTGLVFVGPQTVKVVREPGWGSPGEPIALVNDSGHLKVNMIWPRIPWTGVGVKEESYSLKEPQKINAKIELFPLSRITGIPEDKNTMVYLTISGTAEITNWQKFLSVFDTKKAEDPEIKKLTRLEFAGHWVGSALFSEVDYWLQEFRMRAYLAKHFADEYNLETAEEIEQFIKENRVWYWALGVFYPYQAQEIVKINPWLSGFLVDVIAAIEIERAIENLKWMLSVLEYQRDAFYEELDSEVIEKAEAIISEFKQYLKDQGKTFSWIDQPKKELSDFLVKQIMKGESYSPEELFAARFLVSLAREQVQLEGYLKFYEDYAAALSDKFKSLAAYHSEGNTSLWRAAIQEVIKVKDGYPRLGLIEFYPWLKEGGMKYLEERARDYQWLLENNFGAKFDLSFEIIEEEVPAK